MRIGATIIISCAPYGVRAMAMISSPRHGIGVASLIMNSSAPWGLAAINNGFIYPSEGIAVLQRKGNDHIIPAQTQIFWGEIYGGKNC